MNQINKKLCVKGERISLYFASKEAKKLVFNMTQDDEIKDLMFGEGGNWCTWEEYKDIEDEYYTGQPGVNNYLLIEYNGEFIGAISHAYHGSKIRNMELDIWLRSTSYTGKGLGVEAINLLIEYLRKTYEIKTFIT